MTMQALFVLLVGLSLAAAENAASVSGSYTAPEPEYQAPAPQYETPTQEYEVSAQQYAAPTQQYAAPAQQYAGPAQQYASPAQQYAAPAQQYAAPAQQYAQPAHYGNGGYQYQDFKPYISKGGPLNLGKFKGDWIASGLLVAGLIIVLSLLGLIVVPGLPFTADVIPSVTSLFKGRELGDWSVQDVAVTFLRSGALGDWSLEDVAETVNTVETAIARARRFIDDFQEGQNK